MGRHLRALALAAAAWTGATGCGGGDGGGGSLPLAQFHDAMLSATCHLRVLCGQLPDEATCGATEQEEPHLYASLPQLVAAGRIIYDGQKARACVDEINGLPSCNRSVVDVPGALADCQQVLVGGVPAGGDCFLNEECAHGSCQSAVACDSSVQCCPGTCVAYPQPLAAGADCSDLTLSCQTGTTCTNPPGTSSLICQPLVTTVGASCASISCAESLVCDPVTLTCQLRSSTGGACDPMRGDEDCDDMRDRCDSSSVCSPRVAVGAACDAQGACVAWASCDPTLHTCVELPTAGQTCLAAQGPRCLGLGCDPSTNTCTLTPAGGSCL
jgi:hypothetical protein